ncbi:MAG: hypothetical protein RBR28_10390, partial [Lentimicrobium sp.]|nr:hypothetical protein [Lentimicrobium sp.]
MKTFYRIFGGKRVNLALSILALFATLQVVAQPCTTPPEAYLTGNATICQGSTTAVSINISGGTIPWRVTYSINGVLQPEVSGIVSSPYVLTTSSGGDFKIETVFDADGCTGTITGGIVTVKVNPLPSMANSVTGPTSVCQGQTGVSYSVNPVLNATSYEWTLPAGATIVSGINTDNITVDFSTSASSGNIRARGINACGNGAWSPNLTITVARLPQNPGAISGSTTVCQGQSGVTYSVPVINFANGYEWQLPVGAIITSGTNTNQITVNFSESASSGNIMVRGTNGCGAGQWSAAYAITISNLPIAAGSVNGPTTVCQNQNNLIFSINPVAYATSYQWEFPVGFTVSGSATGSSITLNSGATAVSGVIRARGVNACGNGAFSSDFIIGVNSRPVAYAGVDDNVCAGSSYTLSGASASNSGSVLWSSNGSGSFNNPSNLNATYTPGAGDNNVTLTLTANGIGSCSPATDNMTLTLLALPTVNAGPDMANCGTAALTISGSSASNYGSLLWSTSGSGTFSNPAALHPVYTPSATDVINGSVILTLSAFGTGICAFNSASDQMEVFINPQPTANAGSAASVCEGTTFTVADATASNYTSITWSSSGTGSFLNNGNLTPTYSPSLADVMAGSVNLTLTATPIAPCGINATSVKILSITRRPVVNAGPDASICGLNPFATSGATATNASSYMWTSSGSGSFVNPTLLNATYMPGAGDLLSGSVTLTLSVNGNSPCALPVTDELTLTINTAPVTDAGLDGTTCETTAFTVSTATATNYSTILWNTSGSGTLSNAGTLTPTYTPSHNDALTGTVLLTLTATGTAPCTTTVSDIMQLVITPSPIISAGADFAVCAGSGFMVPGATAQYYSSLDWTSSGTGTFVNANTLSPNYTPSASDIANGTVTLTLTATGNSPCVTPVSSSILVTINQLPQVFAGNDITICEGPYNITAATAINFDALLWTSNGDGIFTNATALNAIYTPGPADLINGIVTLTLTATSMAPCTSVISDNVLYSIRPQPESYAGPNATVCEGGTYELINATAAHYTSLSWSTSGSGNFSNQNTLNPTYTPSLADIANGSVLLTLTVNNPPCNPETSDMTLSIRQNPVANAGTDAAICENSSYTINNASATNAGDILWSSSGSGVLQNPTTLTPTYIPSAADIMIGSVQLTMTVQAMAPCIAQDIDIMEITITRSATAFAGNDATICANQTHTIVGSNASNYSSLAWSTSGDGIILAANSLYPTYIPGTIDESLGFATLTLTAYGNNPCTSNATDQMLLTVVPEPVVNAGPDIQICVGANVPLINATATSTSSIYWSTAGSGTFSDPTLVNPVYTPSAQDIANGTVILNITGQGVSPCSGSATDAMILQISQPPVVVAGSDGEICETEQYYIFDASATNYSAITWTSMGDGSFSNHNSINPTYTPGPADIAAGSVLLYLNATSLLPCSGSVSDAMLLTIHPMPQINAGPNASVCETGTYLLSSATALDYNTLAWTTSGSGGFSNASVLNPIYTPSAGDIINGNVTLTLTATGVLPCGGQVTDQMVLTIRKSPLVNAGIDETICVGSFTITTASASNYHTLQWESSGSSGTLLNANTITPTYQPSAADIAAGSVVLTLTATPNTPCAGNAVDQVLITIRPLTLISAGADANICQGSTFTPNNATAVNYASINWTTSGSGSFINSNTLTPTYTPSPADIALGWIALTLNATSIAPCTQSVSDDMILTITPQAVVDAGLNSTICEGSVYSTSGASATHQTSLLWTSNGSGTFANAGLLVTTYTPSAADIANGSVMLTLTATSQAPCVAPISDFMVLTIQPAALVYAGPDASICQNGSYLVSGATADNYNSLLWTTSGNGTFVDGTTLSPTYTPGSADIAAGTVTLTLTAQPKAPCTAPHSDSFILTVDPLATANAGADDMVCEGTGLLITDASATHFSSLNWTTTGTGTFDNGSTISPTYYPSAEDVANGSVVLTLTANSQLPCSGTAVDSKIVTVTPMPVVNAGPDALSCGAAPYSIAGASASAFATVQWTTSGTGVFTNANMVNSTYNPSAADILSGSVTLTLTTNSAAPCLINPSDA